jgi:hypothetical protein
MCNAGSKEGHFPNFWKGGTEKKKKENKLVAHLI